MFGFGIILVGMSDYEPYPLGLLVGDKEHDVPIGIQSNRMSGGTSKKLSCNNIIFVLGIDPQGKVMTFLLLRVTGETSVIVNVLQGTADYTVHSGNTSAFDLNSGLEVFRVFPQ